MERRKIAVIAAVSLACLGIRPSLCQQPQASQAPVSAAASRPPTTRVVEGFPDRLARKMRPSQNQFLRGLQKMSLASSVAAFSPYYVITLSKRWQPGHTVTVAFRGGDPALYAKIAEAAKDWTRHANIALDFGPNASSGQYRQWSTTDTQFAAEVRICFDQDGYYSLVGTDSINQALTGPRSESMNLQGFDQGLPTDWRGVVLHEFGHALGFEHEHQRPSTPCDFRWQDDPEYVPTTDAYGQFVTDAAGKSPGLYTVLGGPPNKWSHETVDFNLKEFPPSSAFDMSAFDPNSIMKYYFPAWMFVSGEHSACYTGVENVQLSPLDATGVAGAYPVAVSQIQSMMQLHVDALKSLRKVDDIDSATRRNLDLLLEKVPANDR